MPTPGYSTGGPRRPTGGRSRSSCPSAKTSSRSRTGVSSTTARSSRQPGYRPASTWHFISSAASTLPIGRERCAATSSTTHSLRTRPGLDEKQFHYAFANTLSQEESDKIREHYAVPGPAEVLKEGAFANFMRHAAMSVDFENASRAPMLFIAFSEDHVVPPKPIQHMAEKYTARSEERRVG